MNVFQGRFPEGPVPDGYYGTAPWRVPGQRLRPPQDDRERLGVVRDWFAPDLLPLVSPSVGPDRPVVRDPTAFQARRVVPLPRVVLLPVPRRLAQRQYPGQRRR